MDMLLSIPPQSKWPLGVRVMLFGVAYFGCAFLGDALTLRPGNFTSFWPVSGLYVAILLLSKPREWPYFLLGALPANLAFDLLHQRPLLMTIFFSIGNSLEAFVGAWLVRRFVGDKVTLDAPKQVVWLVVLAGLTSTTLSALVGTTTLFHMVGVDNYWTTWFTWWTGDMLGVLLMAPMVILWGNLPWKTLKNWSPFRWGEAFLAVLLAAVLTWITFSDTPKIGIKGVYLLIPLVIFVALRLGMLGVVTIGFELSCLAVLRTSNGLIPIEMEQVHSLQGFLGTVVFTGLVLAAGFEQNQQERKAVRDSEERFRSVLENSLDAAYRRDLRTDRYEYLSPVIEKITGWSVEEMSTTDTPTLLERIHPADIPAVTAAIQHPSHISDHKPRPSDFLQYRLRGRDGKYRWLEDHFTLITDAQGTPIYRLGIVRDASRRKQVEEALRISEGNFRRIFEEAPIGMATLSADYHFLSANAAFCKMLGYNPVELADLTFANITHPEHLSQDLVFVKKLYAGENSIYHTEKRYLRKDGGILTAELTLTVSRDVEGNFLHFLAMIEDVSERVRLLAELENRAVHDQLTGALNRWGLFQTIQSELNRARRYSHPISIILFDIDNFKNVNDTYGHATGDYILQEVAGICLTTIRSSDALARYGGDEFVILLPEIGLELACQAADRLRLAIAENPFHFENAWLNVTISVGVTVDISNQFTLDHFLRCADRALYNAKAAGKNCTRAFTTPNL
jgi:diguanylate cyclase (GGDEF)-like protein/PAS domain S-box-containing protein